MASDLAHPLHAGLAPADSAEAGVPLESVDPKADVATDPVRKPKGIRLQSLDGLRGVASMMVVTHHLMLTWPLLALPLWAMDWQPGDNAMSWVFASPLPPFIDAAYWVHVFFIISGIVLTLPVVHAAKKFSWKAYYPRRLVRIYLPVFAAVLLALLWVVSIDRTNMRSPFFTWDQGSMAPHAEDFPSLHYVLDDMLLLGRPGHIDIPLWSLHFEILFSLLLPVAIWIGVKGQKLFVPLILACLLIISASQSVYFTYGALMPLFGIGVLMAVRYPTLQEWADRITNHRRGNWMWGGLALTGFLLLGSHWTQYAFGGNLTIRNAMQGVSDLGVVLLIFTAIFCRPVVRVLSARPIQFLGVMAFSTYLVHEPVVTGIAALFGEGNQFWAMLVSVPLAIGLARIFHILVERPAMNMSRDIAVKIKDKEKAREQAALEAAPEPAS